MPTRCAKLGVAMRRLWGDTGGAILPYVTIMLVVIVGTSVLALDGARYMSLQSQLQKGADAMAIAGAVELDRLPDAITRATAAVNNLITTNSSLFGTGDRANVTVSSIQFLSSLPASDNTYPIPAANVLCSPPTCTSSDAIGARFIQVTVQPTTIPTILPAAFFGGTNSVTAGAAAVAGNDSVSCGLTPIFVCNPFEQPGDTYTEATERLQAAAVDPVSHRKLLRFADGDNNSGTWGPGDFGYLVPEPGTLPSDGCFSNAGNNIGTAMAAARPLVCVRQNGVDLQPGNTTEAVNGLNTRFGLYGNSMAQSCKTSYPPDVNVRKGYAAATGGQADTRWCRANPDGNPSGGTPTWPPGKNGKSLPVDSCFMSNSCSPANIGGSTWNCLTYWNASHPAALGHIPPPGCTAAATISRYDVYQYEISNNYLADANPTTGETGAPQCSPATARPNRRIIYTAIVNCGSSPVAIQSNAQNVPVAGFAKFFLTVPVPNASQNKPYAEFLGLVERGDGVLFDQVQLYR